MKAPKPQPKNRQIDADTLTRNWNELLQELRVTQTGVQILTGFLLTLPFTQRFTQLTATQEAIYLAVLSGSVATTGLMVAPVAFHRVLFRRRARFWLVEAANTSARLGLALFALTCSGVLFLVFDVTVGRTGAVVAAVTALVFLVALWGSVPWWFRNNGDQQQRGSRERD